MSPGPRLVCAVLALLTSMAAAESLPRGFPTRRGPLVFVPTSALVDPTAETLRWLSRFDLILTNGYDLAPVQTRLPLQRAGSHVFLYVWSNGFTEKEARGELPQSPWWREVLAQHPEWLLNRDPLQGPPGTPPSYYFDLSQQNMREWLGRRLADWRSATGYDGCFFDMAGSTALPDEIRKLWQAAHPDLPYDQAFLQTLQAVRGADPESLIMANQAYNTLPEALRIVDYDLTESYGASYLWGPEQKVGDRVLPETYLRPWRGAFGLRSMYGAVQAALEKTPPRRGFLYLDYMRPRYRPLAADGQDWQSELDREAIYYSYVAARLFGAEAFCSGWYAGFEYRGPLYFADLGRPVGNRPRQYKGIAIREYERGIVALLAAPEAADASLRVRHTGALYDLYTGRSLPVREGRATIRLEPSCSPLTGTVNPIGRVFLKTTT